MHLTAKKYALRWWDTVRAKFFALSNIAVERFHHSEYELCGPLWWLVALSFFPLMKTIKKRQGQKGDEYWKNATKGQKYREKMEHEGKKTNRTKETGKREMWKTIQTILQFNVLYYSLLWMMSPCNWLYFLTLKSICKHIELIWLWQTAVVTALSLLQSSISDLIFNEIHAQNNTIEQVHMMLYAEKPSSVDSDIKTDGL